MTTLEARAEARKRWGKSGWAWEGSGFAVARGAFRVGVWVRGGPRAHGYGATYEAAFADADMRNERNENGPVAERPESQ